MFYRKQRKNFTHTKKNVFPVSISLHLKLDTKTPTYRKTNCTLSKICHIHDIIQAQFILKILLKHALRLVMTQGKIYVIE